MRRIHNYGRIEDALDKWEICAVTGKVDRVKDERAEMAVDLSVDSRRGRSLVWSMPV